MNFDDRVSAARMELDSMFSDTEVPDADGVRRRHRNRIAVRATAAGTLVLALVVGVAAFSGTDDKRGVTPPATDAPRITDTTTKPTTSTTKPTTPTTTTTIIDSMPVAPGDVTVGVIGNRIVELDGTFGVKRDIVQLAANKTASEIAIANDSVYYIEVVDSEAQEWCGPLLRVPLAGGTPEQVKELTHAFAVSPDGRGLAYAASTGCGAPAGRNEGAVVIEREGAAPHRWSTTVSDDFFDSQVRPQHIVWSPDGRQLAVEWCYEDCATILLDADSDGVFAQRNAVGGEGPLFVDGALVTTSTYYPEIPAGGLDLERYDLGTHERTTLDPPFDGDITFLTAGPRGWIYGVTRPYGSVGFRLQRLNDGMEGEPVTGLPEGLENIAFEYRTVPLPSDLLDGF